MPNPLQRNAERTLTKIATRWLSFLAPKFFFITCHSLQGSCAIVQCSQRTTERYEESTETGWRQFQETGEGKAFVSSNLIVSQRELSIKISIAYFQVLKTINKENFINMLSGKATVGSEEPAEKRSRVEREVEEEEEEVEEKEEKQSSWSILR